MVAAGGECWDAAVVRDVSVGVVVREVARLCALEAVEKWGGRCLLPDTIQNLFYSATDKTTPFNGFAT